MSENTPSSTQLRRLSRRSKTAIAVALLAAGFLYLNNTSLLADRAGIKPTLLAHRGIYQRFDPTGVEWDTCTATRMFPPTHRYLENTLPSIRRAFELGADVIEIDIHPTIDGRFAVFHDWTLDCRTNGHGVTREHSMAELKKLDIGYGYTADGGRTFPFRGKGIGMMPSLDEVLAAFPNGSFLINVKSRDPHEGEMLAEYLSRLAPGRRSQLMVIGAEAALTTLRHRVPDVRVHSKELGKQCLIRYVAIGWVGYVPESCRNTLSIIPLNFAKWLWGWPNRFLDRMNRAGTRFFVINDYSGGLPSTIDTREDLARLPEGYSGGIVTNEIAIIGPSVKGVKSDEETGRKK